MFKLPKPKNTLKTIATVAIAIGGVMFSKVAEALTINITYAPGTTLEQRTAVEMAKNIVSAYLIQGDDTINIYVGMTNTMSTDYLALATPAIVTTKNYKQFQQVINATGIKPDGHYEMLTRDNGNPEKSKFEKSDKLMITSANGKVIDFKLKFPKQYNGLDGYIQFNNNIPWHYNYTTATPMTKYDMTTIAMHEMFHVLGVVSGVDPSNIKKPFPTTLDLFRYSEESLSQGAVDFRQGSRSYLSQDIIGTNSGKYLSKGVDISVGGDGYQGSHWENNPANPVGIMNPTQYAGQKMGITESDLMLLSLIGYDVNAANPDLPKLYNDAQTQAASATIVDQSSAVEEMIKRSGVYETGGSGGGTCPTTGCGWFERAGEGPNHNHNHDHDHN